MGIPQGVHRVVYTLGYSRFTVGLVLSHPGVIPVSLWASSQASLVIPVSLLVEERPPVFNSRFTVG